MSSSSGLPPLLSRETFSNELKNYKQCLYCNMTFKNYNLAFAGCQHDFKVCTDCYNQSIKKHMTLLATITCPLCAKEMMSDQNGPLTVFRTLPWSFKEQVKSYLRSLTLNKKSRICMINGCGGSIPNEICQKCLTHYCPKCKQVQHPLDACSISTKLPSSTFTQDKSILKCPRCDYQNRLSKKDRKKMIKCNNIYCKVNLCTEHKLMWDLKHGQIHPEQEKVNTKKAGCEICGIY